MQGNCAVLDLFLGLKVMEFFLERAGHADLDALGQLGRVQIPQTVVLLFQLHIAHVERTQIKPAGFQRAVQLIALILFRRGAKDVVRFAVVRLGFLVFYCAGLLLVVFEGIVFDFNDMRQQCLGLSPITIHAKLAFLGESEADRGDAALVDVEFLFFILFVGSYDQILAVNDVLIAILDHFHPVLAVLALFKLDGFFRHPVIVGEQSAGDGITLHRCGGESISVFVFFLSFLRLDLFGSHLAVDRFVHVQAKEEVAALVIAGIILRFGTLDGLIILGFLVFCRRRVFLGHRRAVGSGIHVGFHGGNNVHFAARVYLRARVDHSLAIIGRHGHGDGAGHLGLGFIGVLAGIAVLKFRRYLETAVGQQVFGNVENIAAFAVSLDHNGLGDFFFLFLLFAVFVFGFDLFGDLIGHFQASLLELLALRGIDQQAERVSQLNLFQVFVRLVGHVIIGQHRAAVAARQGQLHFFTLVLGILQHFVQLFAVLILGAALHVVQQLLQIAIVVLLRPLFKQIGSLPGAFVFLARLFFVIHEDDHILINALEGFGPFLVQVDFPGEALECLLARHISAHRDALDIVAFPGLHVHDQLGLAVFGHDVGFDLALLLGIVVELDGFIGSRNFLDCFVQLFLGGIIGDEVLDLGPYRVLDGADDTIHHIAHHPGQGIVRSLDGGRGRLIRHLFRCVGQNLHVALGVHHSVCAQLRFHILKRNGNSHVTAGNAFLLSAPVGCGGRVHIAVGAHLHAAGSGRNSTVHNVMGIAHQHGHSDGKRRAEGTGIRAGAGFQIGRRADGNVLDAFNDSAFLNIDAGVRVRNAYAEGQAFAFGQAQHVHTHGHICLGVHLHRTVRAGIVELDIHAALSVFNTCRDFIQVFHARVHLARDIHAGMGQLHVDHVQGAEGDRHGNNTAHIQDAAGQIHLSQDDDVAAGIHRGMFADYDFCVFIDIIQVSRFDGSRGDPATSFTQHGNVDLLLVFFIERREVAPVLAGTGFGLDLHRVGQQDAVDLNVLRIQHQIHAAHVNDGAFVNFQFVFAVQGRGGVDQHIGQRQSFLRRDANAGQRAGGRVDHIVRKAKRRTVIHFPVGRRQLDRPFVFQFIGHHFNIRRLNIQLILMLAHQRHIRQGAISARILPIGGILSFIFLFLIRHRPQRTGDMHGVVAAAARNIHRGCRVGYGHIHAGFIVAFAQCHIDLADGRRSFACIPDRHGVVPRAGVHGDAAVACGMGVHVHAVAAVAGFNGGFPRLRVIGQLHLVVIRAGLDRNGRAVADLRFHAVRAVTGLDGGGRFFAQRRFHLVVPSAGIYFDFLAGAVGQLDRIAAFPGNNL